MKFCDFISRHIALIVFGAAICALYFPKTFLWMDGSLVPPLLMLIMFAMGLNMNARDFKEVLVHPKDVLIGCAAQFTLMPLIAYALSKIFALDPALAAGVILVGACPGGTASNVITFIAKGDVALSIGMTAVNTLLAPVITPLIVYLCLRKNVEVDALKMAWSIFEVVIIPIAFGLAIKRIFKDKLNTLAKISPSMAVAAIALIVGCIVSHNSQNIFDGAGVIFCVVILHNILGFACGFLIARMFGMSLSKTKALSIEIGMQNSGLAASLASSAFPSLAMAAVPGAIFSVWHNISGAILAQLYKKLEK
ncbi:bile acid:sodium symporter family protein [Intestinicryptomonas porci]|uniref:Bile acid:sodium symporter family protein n=1 Tax=Intestinicryptomonas porci TaxID=2926320 RepID=A0ABU4WGB1_9BACT|nr:bile acid:sodium symporter family protein [Opitutales bacterium CLA-KB-P66]